MNSFLFNSNRYLHKNICVLLQMFRLVLAVALVAVAVAAVMPRDPSLDAEWRAYMSHHHKQYQLGEEQSRYLHMFDHLGQTFLMFRLSRIFYLPTV